MNEFEKKYYEDESFWSDGMVTDESNIKRIKSTIELIPKDVKSLLDVGCGNGVFLNALFDFNGITFCFSERHFQFTVLTITFGFKKGSMTVTSQCQF